MGSLAFSLLVWEGGEVQWVGFRCHLAEKETLEQVLEIQRGENRRAFRGPKEVLKRC